jgi:hypothetical protein
MPRQSPDAATRPPAGRRSACCAEDRRRSGRASTATSGMAATRRAARSCGGWPGRGDGRCARVRGASRWRGCGRRSIRAAGATASGGLRGELATCLQAARPRVRDGDGGPGFRLWIAERAGWPSFADTQIAWEFYFLHQRDNVRRSMSDGYRCRRLRADEPLLPEQEEERFACDHRNVLRSAAAGRDPVCRRPAHTEREPSREAQRCAWRPCLPAVSRPARATRAQRVRCKPASRSSLGREPANQTGVASAR